MELLNDMRFGKLSERSKSRLMALSREVKYPDSVEPTELYVPVAFSDGSWANRWFRRFPTKREVQFANDSRLSKLSGMTRTFRCNDHAGRDDKDQEITPEQAKSQLNKCVLAPETMALKVGYPAPSISDGPTLPTLGRRAGNADQGTEVFHLRRARSDTQTERRARSARQRFGRKGHGFPHLSTGKGGLQNPSGSIPKGQRREPKDRRGMDSGTLVVEPNQVASRRVPERPEEAHPSARVHG